MNLRKPLIAQHYFYLCDNQPYFSSWTDWSVYGGFSSFYEMFCNEVMENQEFDSRKLYSVFLGFRRYTKHSTKIGSYSLAIKEISLETCLAEAKQKAKEIRANKSDESDLMAYKLEELCRFLELRK